MSRAIKKWLFGYLSPIPHAIWAVFPRAGIDMIDGLALL